MELPDMHADELERFMTDNGAILPLSAHDRIALRIRRRRRSIARHAALGEAWLPNQRLALSGGGAQTLQQTVYRVLVLGEETEGKSELATFLSSSGTPSNATSAAVGKLSSPHLFAVKQVRMQTSPTGSAASEQPSQSSSSHALLEVFVPPVGADAQGLRLELQQHVDAVVLVYSIADPASLDAVAKGQWQQELDEGNLLRRREGSALLRNIGSERDAHNLSGGGAAGDDTPPLLLIGMDAEVRQHQPHSTSGGGATTTTTSSKAAVRAAQELRAAKYMEVFTGKAAHYKAVWGQLLSCMEQHRQQLQEQQRNHSEDATSSNDTSYARGCPLYEHLRPEAPTLVADAASRQLRVSHTSLPDEMSLDKERRHRAGATHAVHPQHDVQFAYALDPPHVPTPEPPIPGAEVSPAVSWFLNSSAARVPSSGSIHLGTTPPLPRTVAVVALARCLFPSREAVIELPRTSHLPPAFIDVATRTFQLCLPHDDALSPTYLAMLGVRYTLDGSEPTLASPLYLGPVDILHGAPTATSQQMREQRSNSYHNVHHIAEDGSGGASSSPSSTSVPYAPWPSHSAPPPRMVKYACVSDSAFRSETSTVLVPTVLDAPRVTVSQHDRTLRVEGSLNPLAVYRYTVDGTTPTYTNGIEYVRPVALPSSTSGAVVRVVCLPRLHFPSEEVVVTSTSQPAVTASSTQQQQPGGGQSRQHHQYRDASISSTTQKLSQQQQQVAVDRIQLQASPSRLLDRSAVSASRPLPQHGSSPLRQRQPPLPSSTSSPSRHMQQQQHAVFATTRTSTIRAELTHTKRQQEQLRDDTPVMLVAPGSRGASPIVRSRGGTPERSVSASGGVPSWNHVVPAATAASLQYMVTPERSQHQRVNNVGGVRVQSPQRGITPTKKLPAVSARSSHQPFAASATARAHITPAVHEAQNEAVGCVAAENQVDFDFPNPISLSHITVATPGNGQGPRSYEIFVILHDTESWMGVGSGDLDDKESVQCMTVVPSARAMPVVRVRCVFGGPIHDDEVDGRVATGRRPKAFEVRDMKVHGRPYIQAANGKQQPPPPAAEVRKQQPQYQWEV